MAKKRFGQHFLTDPSILERIVSFARISPTDTVVEIGPGRGSLTRAIARVARQVVAVEIDRDLIAELRGNLPANVELVEADGLEVDLTTLTNQPFHLIGNLPYNVATPLLDRFIRARHYIQSVTVMVQKEVADRILAEPGTRQYSPLSIGIQYYADVAPGFTVPPGAFAPTPKVQSRVIRLTWHSDRPDSPKLIPFVGRAFASRRKKLINNLNAMYPEMNRQALTEVLENLSLNPDLRPENLSVKDFVRLHHALEAR